ncbi:hypothetical protein PG990_007688 [Apiospora arundinis]
MAQLDMSRAMFIRQMFLEIGTFLLYPLSLLVVWHFHVVFRSPDALDVGRQWLALLEGLYDLNNEVSLPGCDLKGTLRNGRLAIPVATGSFADDGGGFDVAAGAAGTDGLEPCGLRREEGGGSCDGFEGAADDEGNEGGGGREGAGRDADWRWGFGWGGMED